MAQVLSGWFAILQGKQIFGGCKTRQRLKSISPAAETWIVRQVETSLRCVADSTIDVDICDGRLIARKPAAAIEHSSSTFSPALPSFMDMARVDSWRIGGGSRPRSSTAAAP